MAEVNPVVELKNVSIKAGGATILTTINLVIHENEQWAIVGNSGTGKTTLAHALTGNNFFTGSINYYPSKSQTHTKVILVEQQHRFKNLSNTNDFYYQQRFNSSDAENSITVEEALQSFAAGDSDGKSIKKWVDILHLAPLLEERLIQLSNGENKRLQIAEALLSDPSMLILDNPFIGLDVEGRKTLHTIIDTITKMGIHVLLITSPQELPAGITHVAVLSNGTLTPFIKEQYLSLLKTGIKKERSFLDSIQLGKIDTAGETDFSYAVRMKNVSIQYGDKKILDTINWDVKKSECWNISGPNGAGKSTLLSLITADNPQAYANEIYLFDQRRGSGESIWDIKRKIGYVSPELHLFFEQHNSVFEVIGSGLFDTIGLFRKLSVEQEEKVDIWIELFQLGKLRQRPLFQLSLGQQRMVLLARALVKNPPLLILDEPCQGLDEEQSDYFKNSIDLLSRHFNTTLLYVSHYTKDIPSCVANYLKIEQGKQVK